jgi:hypothetical protein
MFRFERFRAESTLEGLWHNGDIAYFHCLWRLTTATTSTSIAEGVE